MSDDGRAGDGARRTGTHGASWVAEFEAARRGAFIDASSADWHPSASTAEWVLASASVWVLDPSLSRTCLVPHSRRGWVPPGGVTERGESIVVGAFRELREETGLVGDPTGGVALVAGGDRDLNGRPTLRLDITYGAVCSLDAPLVAEEGRHPAWFHLEDEWPSVYPDDRGRLQQWADHLRDHPPRA